MRSVGGWDELDEVWHCAVEINHTHNPRRGNRRICQSRGKAPVGRWVAPRLVAAGELRELSNNRAISTVGVGVQNQDRSRAADHREPSAGRYGEARRPAAVRSSEGAQVVNVGY